VHHLQRHTSVLARAFQSGYETGWGLMTAQIHRDRERLILSTFCGLNPYLPLHQQRVGVGMHESAYGREGAQVMI
jgi:hypothetical protein